MNKKVVFSTMALATALFFASCDKDEKVAKPQIKNLEIGIDNSNIGYIGHDLHIDAEIIAEGKIDFVTIELHPEFEGGEDIEVKYTEFAGLKNAKLHKHIDIPEDALAGTYHFHIVVTDQEGNQTSEEKEVEIKELGDQEAPKH